MANEHVPEEVQARWLAKLGRLTRQVSTQRRWLRGNAQALKPLVWHTVQAAQVGELEARQLSKVEADSAKT